MAAPKSGAGWREGLLFLVSLVIAFAVAEIALRAHHLWRDPGSLQDLPQASEKPPPGSDTVLGKILMPSPYQRLVFQLKPEVDVFIQGVRVKTSSAGWREDEIVTEKPQGTRRIVGIGDSVMFGWRVEAKRRYMDVLERLLRKRYPESAWETITLAAPGYNLVMEVEALERFGMAYAPDLIIYGWVGNDFCLPNFVTPQRSIWSLESFLKHYLVGEPTSPELINRKWVVDGPTAGMEVGIGDLTLAEFRAAYCSPQSVPAEYSALVGYEAFQEALERLAHLGREQEIPVVFLNYGRGRPWESLDVPDGVQIIDLQNLYRRYLKRSGYSSVIGSDLAVDPKDPHPSVKAHRLIARGLLDALEKQGVISLMQAEKDAD